MRFVERTPAGEHSARLTLKTLRRQHPAKVVPFMPRRITLRDIATAAEVDISTVSRALRNSPSVRSDTRALIQKAASDLGYIPDPAMSALVAYRKGVRTSSYQSTIAWLDNWRVRGELRKIEAFDEYFVGAAERAARFGYKLDEFPLRSKGLTPGRLGAILRARNIRGIIVAPQQHDGEKLGFDFADFSAVALGYSLRPASLHVVTNHQFLSATLAMSRLRALGYRRIGLYLYADWDLKVNEGYSSGFLSAQKHVAKKNRIAPFLHDVPESAPENIISDAFRAWAGRARPDAIISQGLSDKLGDWLKPLGLRVPRDIGIADLSTPSDKPDVTGIYQNNRRIGATAVDLVVGMIQRNERGLPDTLLYTLVDGIWRPGKTVRTIVSDPARAPI